MQAIRKYKSIRVHLPHSPYKRKEGREFYLSAFFYSAKMIAAMNRIM